MKTKIFAIRDCKMMVYHSPFVQPSDIVAVRCLQMAMGNKDSQLSVFPEDFELFELGEFDDESGMLNSNEQPRFIISATTIEAMEKKRSLKNLGKEEHNDSGI